MSNTTSPPTLVAESGIHSVVWAEFLAPVLAGTETVLRQVELPSRADRIRFDDLGTLALDFGGESASTSLLVGAGWTALIARTRGRNGSVTVRAADLATAKAGAALFAERIPRDATVVDTTVAIDFWQVTDEVYNRTRRVDAPLWDEITSNYPAEVAAAMEQLMATDLDSATGRLMLWHGPPGTGKTTALRALARAWAERCRVQVLLDPERIFAASGNLFEVLLDESVKAGRWRLLVIEDADELIRADAKERVGQSLARLLNLTDGLLGQGMRVLTLITTNEPISRLHPALVRPGRCLAEVEFRAFNSEEARARWPGRSFGHGPVSLATALHPDSVVSTPADDTPLGLYL